MLGPLPVLYKLLVALTATVVCAAVGMWGAVVLPYYDLVVVGSGVGLAIGGLCVFFLLHDFGRAPSPEPARIRRTRDR